MMEHTFITLASEVLNRCIILVPVFPEDGHDENGFITFTPQSAPPNAPALYLLYYSETRFSTPHFQSIRPSVRVRQQASESVKYFEHAPNLRNCVQYQYRERVSLGTLPDNTEDIANPQLQSTVCTRNTTRNKRKETSNPREMSYLDSSNIVIGKRQRHQKS